LERWFAMTADHHPHPIRRAHV